MKKVVIIASVFMAAVIFTVILSQKNREPLRNVLADNIKKIDISKASDCITVEKGDDITLLLNALKEMKLIRKMSNDKDGFAFIIQIALENGETMKIIIRSKDIIVNNKYYKPDKDYCDKFNEIFHQLSLQ